MKLQFLSHSAFLITTNSGSRILIDPFLDGNPVAPIKSEQITADYILITHGHGDHLGDALKIAKRCNSLIICNDELANYCIRKGAKAHNMHIGGQRAFPFGKVKLVMALHGSMTPDDYYAGPAVGFLIQIEGKTIYHTGDTGLFYDMKLIGEMNKIDVFLVPIGDNFTMGITDAVKAVEFVQPELTIPMHYNTFPVISNDPLEFQKKVLEKDRSCQVLAFGQEIEI